MLVDPGDFTADALMAIAPRCGEGCPAGSVQLAGGRKIYPHRPDLWDGHYWRCRCGAYCGVHPNLKPLGSPANTETRQARSSAHAAFDPLWQKRQRLSGISRAKARAKGYKWLAAQLGIAAKDCHIGMMDAATARRVVEICRAARNA
jgi:hypothetical protein